MQSATGGVRAALLTAALVLLVHRPARAQDVEPAPEADHGSPDRLEFGGRVYVRDTLTAIDFADDTTWLEERTIDSARVFLVFRPNKRTRMALEVGTSPAIRPRSRTRSSATRCARTSI